jgi:DNA-binding CsgD family transcriptional regulator
MREVSVRILHFSVDLARAGGLDEKALTAGLPSLALVDGKLPDWFDWDDLVEIIERLEQRLGGPEGMARAMRAAAPVAYPEIRAFASVFIHPIPAFTFVMTRLLATMYRNTVVDELVQVGENRVRWRQSIPEPLRESAAFHRSTKGFVELFPHHLDLPEARVTELEMTPRTAEFVVEFPPTDTLRGRSAHVASVLAVQLDEAFSVIVEALRGSPDGPRPGITSSRPPNGDTGWAERLALSPRQRDVFALLVEGRANKDIAAALGCSERNVEFHVGRILRAAGVTSRAELLVKVLGARA